MAKEIPFDKSFASHEKAQYWSDKNELKPKQVMKGSHKKYIFDCNCGHEIEISMGNVNKGKWCSYCSNPPKKICNNKDCKNCIEKSFASHEKAKYWSDKNELDPRQLFKNSNTKYIFKCDKCIHIFNISLANINAGSWCPYCNGNHKLCDDNDCKDCYNKSFSSHEKSKFWSDKNKTTVRQEFKNSNKKFLFNCNKCTHSFEMTLADVNAGYWCPYCANKKLCVTVDCNECCEKSFASHAKAIYWSNINIDNPRQIFKGDNKKYLFDCNICYHSFEQYITVISRGGFCSYCNGDKLCDNNECKFCYNKSFASHDKSQYWSNKNNNKPREINKQTHNKYLFECIICNHTFEAILSNIIKNQWCSYCNGHHKLCDDNDCKDCYNKSFASHEKSKFWSDKNKTTVRQEFKNSNKKFLFNCDKNHNFSANLGNISNGCWCPYCVNKTEQKLYDNLQPIYNNLEQQFKVEWCKSDFTNKCYPFDFILEEHKIIIELDGIQHFEQVSNWDSPQKTHERDKYKMKQANDNGYSIIRILQEDVFYDTYQWLEELKTNIEKIITENKVQNIFMCKDNEYKIFEVLE